METKKQKKKMGFGSTLAQIDSHAFWDGMLAGTSAARGLTNRCCRTAQYRENGESAGSLVGPGAPQHSRVHLRGGGIHFIKPGRAVNSIQSERGPRASSPTRASQGRSQTHELRSNGFKSRPVTTATAHARQAQAYLIYGHEGKYSDVCRKTNLSVSIFCILLANVQEENYSGEKRTEIT